MTLSPERRRGPDPFRSAVGATALAIPGFAAREVPLLRGKDSPLIRAQRSVRLSRDLRAFHPHWHRPREFPTLKQELRKFQRDSSSRQKATEAVMFSEALRRFRTARGWSQEQLSAEAGVTLNYVGNLERGEQGPSLHILIKLARAF